MEELWHRDLPHPYRITAIDPEGYLYMGAGSGYECMTLDGELHHTGHGSPYSWALIDAQRCYWTDYTEAYGVPGLLLYLNSTE